MESTEYNRTLESSYPSQVLCNVQENKPGDNHRQSQHGTPSHAAYNAPHPHGGATYYNHTASVSHGPPDHAPQHHPGLYRNENLINQDNAHYKQLRARAVQEGDEMARCFEESHRAYEAHDGARAKELSNEGHAHQSAMNNLNTQASEWIFKANNTDSRPGEIDLHGLYVREAIIHTERAIQEAQSRGDSEIHLIVGKGLHSTEHVSKLEPAIEELMRRYNLAAHLEEHNSGVLVVSLDGGRSDRSLGLDGISRRLENSDKDGCVVM